MLEAVRLRIKPTHSSQREQRYQDLDGNERESLFLGLYVSRTFGLCSTGFCLRPHAMKKKSFEIRSLVKGVNAIKGLNVLFVQI